MDGAAVSVGKFWPSLARMLPVLDRVLLQLILLTSAAFSLYSDDEIDGYIRSEMELNAIPGLSLAVVDGGKLAWAKAYGVLQPVSH